jgi:hypothetical protein
MALLGVAVGGRWLLVEVAFGAFGLGPHSAAVKGSASELMREGLCEKEVKGKSAYAEGVGLEGSSNDRHCHWHRPSPNLPKSCLERPCAPVDRSPCQGDPPSSRPKKSNLSAVLQLTEFQTDEALAAS